MFSRHEGDPHITYCLKKVSQGMLVHRMYSVHAHTLMGMLINFVHSNNASPSAQSWDG